MFEYMIISSMYSMYLIMESKLSTSPLQISYKSILNSKVFFEFVEFLVHSKPASYGDNPKVIITTNIDPDENFKRKS